MLNYVCKYSQGVHDFGNVLQYLHVTNYEKILLVCRHNLIISIAKKKIYINRRFLKIDYFIINYETSVGINYNQITVQDTIVF